MVEGEEILLRIVGVRGFLSGEEQVVRVGEAVVVGRSRRADMSVRRSRRFLDRTDRTEVMQTDAFLSVSREHVRIRFLHPDLVEVEDLSANGTFLDGRRVDRVGLTDLRATPHVLSLGSMERIRLELAK